MKKKRKTKRKVDLPHLLTFICVCLTFTIAIGLLCYGTYQAFFGHDYNVILKNPLSLLPRSFLDEDCLSGDMYKSYEDENYTSSFGIDVSSHQKNIDWENVAKSGVEFAYLRVGYRGYQGGSLNLDETFYDNYRGAKQAGIKVGVYFFSQAISQVEAIDEAYFVRDAIKNLDIDLPVAYDLEDIDYDEGRIEDLTNNEKTTFALSFCAKMEDFGYNSIIYTNFEWSKFHYDLNQIMNYDIWFAQYNDLPYFEYAFKIWQYTDQGIIPGIQEPVDLNLMLIKKDK